MTAMLDRGVAQEQSVSTTIAAPLPFRRAHDVVARSLYDAQSPATRPHLDVQFPPGSQPAEHVAMVRTALYQVNELRLLQDGWDGRRGRRITDRASVAAILVAHFVGVDTEARPQVFPLPDGGLQVEWHYGENDIEVEIEAAGSLHVLAVDVDRKPIVDTEAEDVYAAVGALRNSHAFLVESVSRNLGGR